MEILVRYREGNRDKGGGLGEEKGERNEEMEKNFV